MGIAMATATRTAPKTRIGPADRGRRMTPGRVHRGRVPGGLALRAGARSRRGDGSTRPLAWADRRCGSPGCSCTMTSSTPAIIKYQAGGGECRSEAAGHGLGSPPRPGDLPGSGTVRPRRLDAVDPSHRRRGRQPPRQEARLRRQARGIPAAWASANTGSSTRRSVRCTPWSAKAIPGKKRSSPSRGVYRTIFLPGLEVRPGELLGPPAR